MPDPSRKSDLPETVTHKPEVLPPQPETIGPERGALVGDPVASLREVGQFAQPGPQTPATVAIPGYEILSVLGRGGMGVVYRARQTKLNRIVALKMILAGAHAGPDELERFRTEAEAIARVQHPNIVQVFEVGEHDGLPFFSLEFCGGGSLEQKLQGTPLPPDDAAKLIETLARAIHVAHQKGIIHRDLKPANVLLADDGTQKITDFGLAKKLDEAGKTATGSVMGTPSYMAPEQAGGLVKELGPAADIYALGAVLYECLTGRPPYKAATPLDTLMLVLNSEPVSPRDLNARVPRDLETICLKCLQKVPAKRYATAEDLAEDLRRFRGGETITARPASSVEKAVRWAKRKPAHATAVAVSALAALVLLVGGWWFTNELRLARDAEAKRASELGFSLKETEQAQQAEKERSRDLAAALIKAEEATMLEKATREKAEEDLATSTMTLARSRFEQDNAGVAGDLLEQVQVKYRGSSWGLLKNYVAGSLYTLFGHRSQVNSVSYSPDGQTLASASGNPWGDSATRDNTVRLWDAKSGLELRVLKGHSQPVMSVSYSPDGQVLASASWDQTVRLWEAKSGLELRVLKGHSQPVMSVSYSPDGQTLASASWDGIVRLWDAKSGQELRVLKAHTSKVSSVSYSPDGQTLASASDDNTVRLWDPKSGQVLRVLKGHMFPATSVSYSPDGQTLASASNDQTVRLWDAKSGQELRILKGHTDLVINVSYSPDGQTVASAGRDKTVWLWDAKSGQRLRVLTGHTDQVCSVSYRPDGQTMASASEDKTVRLWDAKSGQELRVLKGHTAPLWGVSYGPDGQTLASASEDKSLRVWVAKSGQELAVLMGHTKEVSSVRYSPHGQNLASASLDRTVRVWDAKGGQQLRVLSGHTNEVWNVSYSTDGQTLASASLDKTVRLWDAKSDQALRVLKGHTAAVRGVSYSPADQTLASTSSDKTVRLWDAKSGQELHVLKGHTDFVTGVSFSPDGLVLASASSDETLRLWDAKSGQELRVLKGHAGRVMSVSFSPDGQTLASASNDQTVRLWDAKSGQELRVLKGHTGGVSSVSYNPDGQTLASASFDTTVRLWDVRSNWIPPSEPIPPAELAFRRWVTSPVSQWHVEKRQEAEKEKNAFAAAFHRSWEQHARGVLAFEAGDFNLAYAHFIAAAALKPKVPAAGPK